jgi:hypothetical protein
MSGTVDVRAAAKVAAEAHTNLNTWGAVQTILESGLLYGKTRKHAAARRVIATAKTEQQKWLCVYDSALARIGSTP